MVGDIVSEYAAIWSFKGSCGKVLAYSNFIGLWRVRSSNVWLNCGETHCGVLRVAAVRC